MPLILRAPFASLGYRAGTTFRTLVAGAARHRLPRALIALLLATAPAAWAQPRIELVESVPLETEAVLDDPAIRSTAEVWTEMVESARETLDLEFFYLRHEAGRTLEPVVQAIEKAAQRGVRVRVLVDAKFLKTYPDLYERWRGLPGFSVRSLAFPGGVLHAKLMLVDGEQFFLGSQNFDWTALSHIRELGVHGWSERLTGAYAGVFQRDWDRAGGKPASGPLERQGEWPIQVAGSETGTEVTPTWSPDGPGEDRELVELLRRARRTVEVQVMSYSPLIVNYDQPGTAPGYYTTLDAELRAAAARGVEVRLLVSDWGAKEPHREHLLSLAELPHMQVRINHIPVWSGGEIPYSRVGHSKYLVVDGHSGWIGTSNWEYSYFHTSRDVGLLFDGQNLGSRVHAFFERDWSGPYSQPISVDK